MVGIVIHHQTHIMSMSKRCTASATAKGEDVAAKGYTYSRHTDIIHVSEVTCGLEH